MRNDIERAIKGLEILRKYKPDAQIIKSTAKHSDKAIFYLQDRNFIDVIDHTDKHAVSDIFKSNSNDKMRLIDSGWSVNSDGDVWFFEKSPVKDNVNIKCFDSLFFNDLSMKSNHVHITGDTYTGKSLLSTYFFYQMRKKYKYKIILSTSDNSGYFPDLVFHDPVDISTYEINDLSNLKDFINSMNEDKIYIFNTNNREKFKNNALEFFKIFLQYYKNNNSLFLIDDQFIACELGNVLKEFLHLIHNNDHFLISASQFENSDDILKSNQCIFYAWINVILNSSFSYREIIKLLPLDDNQDNLKDYLRIMPRPTVINGSIHFNSIVYDKYNNDISTYSACIGKDSMLIKE